MMIVGISTIKDASKRYILDIGLTLKEFRKAIVDAVDAPEPVEPVHKDRNRGGPKQKKPPATEVEEKAGGIFEAVADAFALD